MPDFALSIESLYLAETLLTGEQYRLLSTFGFSRAFAELCSVLEAVVLADKIYMFIDSQNSPYNMTEFGKHLQDRAIMEDAWKLAGLKIGAFLHSVEDAHELQSFLQYLAANAFTPAERNIDLQYVSSLVNSDARLEVCFSEAAVVYKPLVWRRFINVDCGGLTTDDHIQSSLLGLFDGVISTGRESMRRRIAFGYPLPFLIPPIVANILYRAGRTDAVIPCAFEIRDEFSHVRERFNELDRTFRDDDLSLNEFDQQWRRYEALVRGLPGQNLQFDKSLLAFVRDFGGFLLKSLLKAGVDWETLYKLLTEAGVQLGKNSLEKLSGRYLTNVISRWRSMTNYSTKIAILFGHELAAEDARVFSHLERLELARSEDFKIRFLL